MVSVDMVGVVTILIVVAVFVWLLTRNKPRWRRS